MDTGIIQISNYLILYFTGKWLTRIQSPGTFVITADTLVHAARDEQRAACAWAVDDIDRVVLMIIYNQCLPLYLALRGCWLRSLTRITYISKLIGINEPHP